MWEIIKNLLKTYLIGIFNTKLEVRSIHLLIYRNLIFNLKSWTLNINMF